MKCLASQRTQATTAPDDLSVGIEGRVFSVRNLGSVVFVDLADGLWKVECKCDQVTHREAHEVASNLRIGDWASMSGSFEGRTGRPPLLHLKECRVTARCIVAVPKANLQKGKSFKDPVVDFVFSRESALVGEIHTLAQRICREELWAQGFDEFCTPVISHWHNGGAARPFEVQIHATEGKGYLRISSEVALKSLLASGWPRVFEIGSQFRNEGLDREHLPEFQMLEAYALHESVENLLATVIRIVSRLAKQISIWRQPSTAHDNPVETTVDSPKKIHARNFFLEHHKLDLSARIEELRAFGGRHGVSLDTNSTGPALVSKLIHHFLRRGNSGLTVIAGLPHSLSPLASLSIEDNQCSDRCWLFLDEVDFCDIAADENDSAKLAQALENQTMELHSIGRAQNENILVRKIYDTGIPPSAGIGLSISRLVMALAGVDDIRKAGHGIGIWTRQLAGR
jgi:lysyl-tRNA synthetase class 2